MQWTQTKTGKEEWKIESVKENNYYDELQSNHKDEIENAFKISNKAERNEALKEIRTKLRELWRTWWAW